MLGAGRAAEDIAEESDGGWPVIVDDPDDPNVAYANVFGHRQDQADALDYDTGYQASRALLLEHWPEVERVAATLLDVGHGVMARRGAGHWMPSISAGTNGE